MQTGCFFDLSTERGRSDANIFGDKVMLLVRTEYADNPLAFTAAFIKAADGYDIPWGQRRETKQVIGKILNERKQEKAQREGDSKTRRQTKGTIAFGVDRKSRREITLVSPFAGGKMTFTRNSAGLAILTSHERGISDIVLRQAYERAEAVFGEIDQEAISVKDLEILTRSESEISMKLALKFTIFISRGQRGHLRAEVRLGGRHVKHKDVPFDLVRDAKQIAASEWKGMGSKRLLGF